MEQRLRIVQVSPADRGGGAERVAFGLNRVYRSRGHDAELAVGLKRRGDDGVVLLRNGGGAWALHDSLRYRGHARAARVVRALASPKVVTDALRGREDFRFPSTSRLLAQTGRPPDVLQLHNLHGAYFDLTLLPSLAARAPVVLSPEDAWLTTGHCAHTLGCERWRGGCGACPHLRVYPALLRDGTQENWQRKRALYEAARVRVGVPCRWLADRLRASMLGPSIIDLRVIPTGIDLGLFSPGDRGSARERLGIDPTAAVIVFAAQGVETNVFKDFATFEHALFELGRSQGAPIAAFALGAHAAKRETIGRLTLNQVPFVSADTMVEYLRAADVYVHPAREDTFPLTVLEALACGVPVVASAVGGIPEQLTPETGTLVAPADPRALSGAISALLASPHRRASMGFAAASDAASRFSVERQGAAYLEWFREIADAESGPRSPT